MLSQNSISPNMTAHRRLSSAIAKFMPGKGKGFVVPPTSPSEFPFPLLLSNSETMKKYDNQRYNKVPFRSPALFPANLNFSQRTIHVFGSSEEEETEAECFSENRDIVLPRPRESTLRKKKLSLSAFGFAKTKAFKPESTKLMSPLSEQGTSSSTRLMPCPQIDMVLATSPIFKDQPTLSASEVLATPPPGWRLSPKTKDSPHHRCVDGSHTPSTCVNTPHKHTPHGKFAMSTGSPGVFNRPSTWGPRPKTTKISLVSPSFLSSPFHTQEFVPASPSTLGPSTDMLASMQFLSELTQNLPECPEEESLLSNSSADEPVTP